MPCTLPLTCIKNQPATYPVCYCQAAYNNTSEAELQEHSDEAESPCVDSAFSVGTKLAKQFDTTWFQGTVRRYDAAEDLYWILYSDGDSEELDSQELQQAVRDYKQHMQHDEDETNADILDIGETAQAVHATQTLAVAMQTTATLSPDVSSSLDAAVKALTAASERLTAAAGRLQTHGTAVRAIPYGSHSCLPSVQQQACDWMWQQQIQTFKKWHQQHQRHLLWRHQRQVLVMKEQQAQQLQQRYIVQQLQQRYIDQQRNWCL